jgi:type I restriction enzyme M protein
MIGSGFIKGIQNEMRKDDGVDGDAQRLSQLVWIIFLKVLDDDEKQKEFLDSSYVPAVPEKYRWKNWAALDDGITGDALLDFVNNDLFPSLKNLEINPANKRTTVVKEVFSNSFNYMKNGTQLRKVINKVNDLDFNTSTDRHAFGDIYETLLASLQSAGNAGEFYTPRPITKFIVEMVDPKLGEKVFDPACGTGGFLTGAIDHIRKEVKTPEDEQLLQNSILGVEKKQLPYTLCVTNMIFHGLEEPSGVRHDNTLARPLISYGPADFVDCITANPPFGGSEEDGVEDNFPTSFRTRETADLFLVLFVRLLKDGGRAGIVLPDGTLFGEGVKTRIKQHLLEECNLHTIIRLPGSVFAPYTSIATNLLFFTKGEPTKEIWYYEHKLPEGVKAYNKTKPIKLEEFEPIKEWWNNRVESEVAWKVSIDEIVKRNYNLDIKNPNTVQVDELDPEEVLANHRAKWTSIDHIANELQKALSETLDHHSNKSVHFLTKNLHEYLRVPSAASLLRKNILHLAVSGQLVPQDPNEGTGKELYQQIQAEKAKLVKNGRIGKQKPTHPIAESEIPFDIPQNWKWVRVRDTGYALGQKKPDKDFYYIDVSSIDNKRAEMTNDLPLISPANAPSRARKLVSDGTVIYSTVRPYLLNTAIIENAEGKELIASTAFAIVHPYAGISSKWILYNFLAPYFVEYVNSKSVGAAYPAINDAAFDKSIIPLPPLTEQTRIVQKTTQLLDLVTQLEQRLDK